MKNYVSLRNDDDLDAHLRRRRLVMPLSVIFLAALVFMMFPGYGMLHIMAPRLQEPKWLWPLYNMGGWLFFCFILFATLVVAIRQVPPIKKYYAVGDGVRNAVANYLWAEKAYGIWKAKGSKHQLKKSHTCIQRIEKFYSPLYEIPKVKALRENILKDMEKIE